MQQREVYREMRKGGVINFLQVYTQAFQLKESSITAHFSHRGCKGAGSAGKEKGGGWQWLEGSFQLFLEATIVFVQDLPPFLLGLPRGGRCEEKGVSP